MHASDPTVLDRQKTLLKWRQQQQQQSSYSYFTSSALNDTILPIPITQTHHQPTFEAITGYLDGEKNDDIGDLSNGWPDLVTASYSIPCLREGTKDSIMARKESSNESKKRKGEETQGGKVCADAEKKKMKGGESVQPKLEMQQSSSDNSDSSNRRGGSKENSKTPEATQKPDYIHVRARRGQATDSHSLAERVRREKISERMKYLQDLVPGCNKITGKAGMLDEIINYVQSLQRQVEFLSMKLAAVNPRLDFNIDHFFFSKEINIACSSSFPTVEMSSNGVDPSYLQPNPLQHAAACGGLDMAINPQELALGRNIGSPVPEPFLESCYNGHGSSLAWDVDIQTLCNVVQGRGFTFPFLSSEGNIIPYNPKIE